jgi:hypothetical protein
MDHTNVEHRHGLSFIEVADILGDSLNFGTFETLVCCTEPSLRRIELRKERALTLLTLPMPKASISDPVCSRAEFVAAVAGYAAPAYPFDDTVSLRELIEQHMSPGRSALHERL